MNVKLIVKTNLLKFINNLIHFTPIMVRGKGDPNRNFEEFFNHLKKIGMSFNTVIDVGVAFGTYSLYEPNKGAQIYLVEPVPQCKPILDKIAQKYNAIGFNVAAGAKDDVISFNVHNDVSGSSALKQVEGTTLDGTTIEVAVRRLDTLIPKNIMRPAVLKIDTQGYELDVLKGGENLLQNIDVIIIECSFHRFRFGAPEILDVMKKLDEYGFIAYEILEGHYRPLDNALAQVDVVFVPKDSVLRTNSGVFSDSQLEKYVGKRTINEPVLADS